MVAPSNEERDAWVEAIHSNIRAHAVSRDDVIVVSRDVIDHSDCIYITLYHDPAPPPPMQLSPSALEISCKELRSMLRAVQASLASADLPSLLLLLHSRTGELCRRGNREL